MVPVKVMVEACHALAFFFWHTWQIDAEHIYIYMYRLIKPAAMDMIETSYFNPSRKIFASIVESI